MTNSCDCQNRDCNCGSNSGFVFGLLCGAVIGAIIAIIIYKNNKTEVFEKLEKKIKEFFDNLVKDYSPKTKKLPKKIQEITPIFVKPKKVAPKMFVKPKK